MNTCSYFETLNCSKAPVNFNPGFIYDQDVIKYSNFGKRASEFEIEEQLDPIVAANALEGYIPFEENDAKRQRYLIFLKSSIESLHSDDIYLNTNEKEEFIEMAFRYQPLSGVMAKRFKQSSQDIPAQIKNCPNERKNNRQEKWNPCDLLLKRFELCDLRSKSDFSAQKSEKSSEHSPNHTKEPLNCSLKSDMATNEIFLKELFCDEFENQSSSKPRTKIKLSFLS